MNFKLKFFIFFTLLLNLQLFSQIWINEYSYDCVDGLDTINSYNDGDEFIEIVAPVGTDMSNYGVIVFGTPPPYTETKILFYQQLSGIISSINSEEGSGFLVITTLLSHQLEYYTPITTGILINQFLGLGQAGLRNGYNAGVLLVNHNSGYVAHGVYSENNYSPKLESIGKDPAISSPGSGPYSFSNIDFLIGTLQDPSISLPLRGFAMIGNGFSRDWILTDGTEQSRNTPGAKNSNQSTLPVELSSLSAIPIGNTVKLNWTTETEVNNYGFEVERTSPIPSPYQGEGGEAGTSTTLSVTGWEKIGFVAGNGNSNSQKNYSFIDENPSGGTEFQYRLKQIDNDGQFEYSKIVEVSLFKPVNFSLKQNYPNPFNPSTSIQFTIGSRQFVQLKVYDVLGNETATLVDEYKPEGMYDVQFTINNLSSGIYFYQLRAGSFLETKKMVITK